MQCSYYEEEEQKRKNEEKATIYIQLANKLRGACYHSLYAGSSNLGLLLVEVPADVTAPSGHPRIAR